MAEKIVHVITTMILIVEGYFIMKDQRMLMAKMLDPLHLCMYASVSERRQLFDSFFRQPQKEEILNKVFPCICT